MMYMYGYPSYYQSQIAGKVVNDFNQIMPNEVPMDGSNATFVKSDLSEIQLRAWNGNGQIQTISYKPVFSQEPQQANISTVAQAQAQNDAINDVVALFNERMDRLEKLLKPTRAKKEVQDE